MTDVMQEISAARRRIETRPLDHTDARAAIISRSYTATIDEVWDACTNPERVARWLMALSGDLRVGGRYQLQGNAGGTIKRCDPPRVLSITWEYGGEVNWVDLRLSSAGDSTRFELAHTVPADAKWVEFGPGAVGPGWDLSVVALGAHLADRTVDPAWIASNDGEAFIRQSSARWCDAHIAAGVDPADARAAADRATAFWCQPAPESVAHVGKASG